MRVALVCLIVLIPVVAFADAPAPWAVCAGKQSGDSCAGKYFPNGVCTPVDAGTCASDGGACLWCVSHGDGSTNGGGGGGGCDVGAHRAAGGAMLLGFAGIAALLAQRRLRRR